MKNLLIICASLALVACSSKPDSSDIENAVGAYFAECKNVKIADVKKTNGHGESDNYKVEFDYTIEVDEEELEAFKLATMAIVDETARRSAEVEKMLKHQSALNEELSRRRREFENSHPSPSAAAFADYNDYSEARKAWVEQLDQGNEDLQAQVRAVGDELIAAARPSHGVKRLDMRAATQELMDFLHKGCNYKVLSWTRGMQDPSVKQQSERFDIVKYPMHGSMTMMKTEQGWRPAN